VAQASPLFVFNDGQSLYGALFATFTAGTATASRFMIYGWAEGAGMTARERVRRLKREPCPFYDLDWGP
jgi:hypothetical protein